MKLLPENFSIAKYGFTARLINEEDAAFILSLRSDQKRTRFMITLKDDIKEQRSWIREYKRREKKGEDYYFLYSKNGEPVSVSRISKINLYNKEGKGGGWIKRRGPRSEALSIFMLIMHIAFEEVDLEYFYFDVHKRNRAAFRIFSEFYSPFYSFYEKDDFFHITCSSEQHVRAVEIFREKYLHS